MLIELISTNGLQWSFVAFMERLGWIGPGRRHELERKKTLPGFNTLSYNRKIWSQYDWSASGEEWNDSADWKNALIDNFIIKYIKPGHVVLEIGPGGGRWATILAGRSAMLHLVDITETTLNLCRKRLTGYTNCKYHLATDGSLPFIADKSVDYVWSFDVFVHIAPTDTQAYIKGFARVMKKGGMGIVHHPADGNVRGGFRSSVTNEFFRHCLETSGFRVIDQTNKLGSSGFDVKHHNDTITVFERV